MAAIGLAASCGGFGAPGAGDLGPWPGAPPPGGSGLGPLLCCFGGMRKPFVVGLP
ncbi:hypothetical protein SacglDRAFT_00321 [Saccharomonospora glauca K62]|uniref:Uncharacterized protein n=1 Tax=Saccharomonospora glauca K62 TaxID=928724 RepID=I1CX52_9PSEU|nr:hypothetical protein SacglDRAFT_00321 [Saccharomonospora glauca K62]